ncbi:TetR/AcrR family transcriptional regulator [Brevibacillus reuszeri]|uniref:TetR family transcriptional regulator n=1 Tax=Brevibacillus reuszeri TaxID=54915 RepID=A0A0K9YNU2_9BACL|nr:TetR/AcrR family transcriptional regulator [Brevibacillus reuszeri]KNB70389.1 TetR family transcriptional regulator [Brevibacillus reuszeri]MED1857918.1 TetR/AcrR family transcriptional regulator [Brevibacillus reuszeri]
MSKARKVDPRIIRTRHLMRDALVSLIDERGYESITVHDITDRATINRATFYLHYRDKQDLLISSTDDILEELITNLEMTDTAEVSFADLEEPPSSFVGMFEQIAKHADFYRVMLSKQHMPYFVMRVQEVLAGFVQEGLSSVLAKDNELSVPREMVIRYTASAFLGVMIWWLENDMTYSPKYMASNLLRIATKGPYTNNPF